MEDKRYFVRIEDLKTGDYSKGQADTVKAAVAIAVKGIGK